MGQIHLRHDQNIAVIEIENPGRLNAFSRAMRAEIGRTLSKLNDDASTMAAVITGRGDAFCAGQDLNESVNWTEETPWVEEFDGFFRDLLRFKKPLVGAINGVAAGGGFQMALLCDARVGHPGVQMGQPEVKRGAGLGDRDLAASAQRRRHARTGARIDGPVDGRRRAEADRYPQSDRPGGPSAAGGLRHLRAARREPGR
ncbi:MAG: hypothetical protein GEV13_10940 [Rhodospirillales bacterium]|nr:hypothetical protein [Rhodospirillales bacterium]